MVEPVIDGYFLKHTVMTIVMLSPACLSLQDDKSYYRSTSPALLKSLTKQASATVTPLNPTTVCDVYVLTCYNVMGHI